ncbi:septation protein SpoVG [candidate division LCP-89 bacterium B3_LCP]|uniref:Putative septation protein SpoVG n=1 Tax=candidate division LCP-89 bacterium B3_LCP TaxID=2012998 RepID=A0A532UZJ6_UNCL8|nr:MAG: septation protein SpoVG [candidate division LCP-89 bacterium B3_LCP]
MEITEININLRDEEKLKAFINITFDDVFVVRGLKVIQGNKGLFVCMPSRKLADGSYKDIAHPISNDFRQHIETLILQKYEKVLENPELQNSPSPQVD